MHIVSVMFLPGSAETDVKWSGKLNSHLMDSCVMHMCTKNY